MKQVTLLYFAVLREQAGCSEERFETSAATPAELYEQARERHGFTLPRSMLRVAVNEEFREWNWPLQANDRVVFIPPVAGG
jgi:molybdopterin converting factor subunit 1